MQNQVNTASCSGARTDDKKSNHYDGVAGMHRRFCGGTNRDRKHH